MEQEATERLVTVDWENGFVESSAKDNENITQVPRHSIETKQCPTNPFTPADFQRAARPGQDHLQLESGAATPPPPVAADDPGRCGRRWPEQCGRGGRDGRARAIRRSVAASAADPRAHHRRQTAVVHYILMVRFSTGQRRWRAQL